MGTILAIEDDPRILKALQRLFSSEGYEIRSANNGKQGLELFAAPGLDAVVLDLMLPGHVRPRYLPVDEAGQPRHPGRSSSAPFPMWPTRSCCSNWAPTIT